MFLLTLFVFILLGITAFDGDYEEKERKKDYEKYHKMFENNGGK